MKVSINTFIFIHLNINSNNLLFLYNKTDSFDCNTDLCHLAWLLRDNCHLLDFNLKNARCDDGTYFTDMSRNLFAKCPGGSEHEHSVWEKEINS